ncbi:hypothetical protein KSS87_004436 [Heliosperma pusillum]|nr:hypothetical protein KSS87_004436 [Heliosperma pusillum]
METPSSTTRITRSQTKALLSNTTNIPSREALLRGQVKNLLQQVEEAAEISKFLSFDAVSGLHGLKAFLNSPAGLRAPTPANTPQVLNFNSALDEFDSLESVIESPIEDQLTVSKVMIDGKGSECEKDMTISRSLFMDFSEKSECSSDCSSVMTFQGSEETLEKKSLMKSALKNDDYEEEDDAASTWSVQVNASIRDEDEDGEEETKSEVLQLEELCERIKNIGMNDYDNNDDECLVRGKLIRFVYDSDDELIHEDEVLRLKGLPTPKGKHLRFRDEEDDE